MTVGSDVKNCYFAIKSAEASLKMLKNKTNHDAAKTSYHEATQLLVEVKDALHEQVLYLSREEPQYK